MTFGDADELFNAHPFSEVRRRFLAYIDLLFCFRFNEHPDFPLVRFEFFDSLYVGDVFPVEPEKFLLVERCFEFAEIFISDKLTPFFVFDKNDAVFGEKVGHVDERKSRILHPFFDNDALRILWRLNPVDQFQNIALYKVRLWLGGHLYYLFERRSLKLFLINAGYGIVSLTIMGLILATWK